MGSGKAWTKVRYQRFGMRNSVERFFGYIKQRTRRFHNNINTWSIKSIEDYATAIAIIRNLTTLTKTPRRRITWLTGSPSSLTRFK
jgi:transposase-like protein